MHETNMIISTLYSMIAITALLASIFEGRVGYMILTIVMALPGWYFYREAHSKVKQSKRADKAHKSGFRSV